MVIDVGKSQPFAHKPSHDLCAAGCYLLPLEPGLDLAQARPGATIRVATYLHARERIHVLAQHAFPTLVEWGVALHVPVPLPVEDEVRTHAVLHDLPLLTAGCGEQAKAIHQLVR